jgi:hypothetical protein
MVVLQREPAARDIVAAAAVLMRFEGLLSIPMDPVDLGCKAAKSPGLGLYAGACHSLPPRCLPSRDVAAAASVRFDRRYLSPFLRTSPVRQQH